MRPTGTGDDDVNERWRVLALMTTAQAGASLVQQALGSLSPILVATFALSNAQLGVVFSAILVGATCFTAISGAFTDRWGERKMLLASAVVMTAALLGATLVVSYPWLVAMTAIYGAGYAASTPAGGRAILAWFDRDRGFAMGIRQTGVSVGALIGAVGLPIVAFYGGYRAAFVFAALLVALPSGIAYVLYRESRDDGTVRVTLVSVARGMKVLVRDPRLIGVTLTCMLLAANQFVMNAFLTITAVDVVRTSVHVAGFALAAAFVGAIGGRLGWGFVSDCYFGGDRFVPLAVICVLAGIAAGMLAFLTAGAVVPLFFASALLGLTASGWNGLMAASLTEVGGTERAASALGLGLTGVFAAAAIAPWVFGLAVDRTSLNWAWAGIAVLSFIATAPVLWLRAWPASPARERARSVT
jgi:ACS family hexuronate transporter-like MFS transporter